MSSLLQCKERPFFFSPPSVAFGIFSLKKKKKKKYLKIENKKFKIKKIKNT